MTQPTINDQLEVELIIKAAITEDDIGTVLRMHMAVDVLLDWYLKLCITSEMDGIVRMPREFGNKLALATAFGLPLAYCKVIRDINHIRNSMAHKKPELNASGVEQLGRSVDKLTDIDDLYKPLKGRYLEIPGSGKKVLYGTGNVRADFYMATMAFYASIFRWGQQFELRQSSAELVK